MEIDWRCLLAASGRSMKSNKENQDFHYFLSFRYFYNRPASRPSLHLFLFFSLFALCCPLSPFLQNGSRGSGLGAACCSNSSIHKEREEIDLLCSSGGREWNEWWSESRVKIELLGLTTHNQSRWNMKLMKLISMEAAGNHSTSLHSLHQWNKSKLFFLCFRSFHLLNEEKGKKDIITVW